MAEIVFSVLVIFYVVPFEGIATTSDDGWLAFTLWWVRLNRKGSIKNLPTTFFSNTGDEIHEEDDWRGVRLYFGLEMAECLGWRQVPLQSRDRCRFELQPPPIGHD